MFLPARVGAIGLSTEAAAPISERSQAASTAVSVDGTCNTVHISLPSSATESEAAIPSGSERAASVNV